MGIFINLVLTIIGITYIAVEIKKIKSNKEVIKTYSEINKEQRKANEILEKDITLRKEHMKEHKLLKKKLDAVNRKLTIANKYNFKSIRR
ncbi:hypothetical protein [Clostridium sp.]|uniref:hypothetical protein n=1 Tax=Clostridium sp. TaxID=1506 RepID=UPI003216E1C0